MAIGGGGRGSPLIVCPRRTLEESASLHDAGHALMMGSQAEDIPEEFTARNFHTTQLVFNDISQQRAGLQMPSAGDVIAILQAGRQALADRRALVINCFAGVSRSPAAAYIIACDRRGPGTEQELAASLRAHSPQATPNAAMIALADDILGRRGAMSAAITAIGRGLECKEGTSFSWTI
ncbi:tyrosine phosphatase family protein [Notoacmeibacter sp. MSK16QG-6]|uniref:tyrosine phosphatase family protein n=1 Tax=Notoacmeibacter sp. MSK16QG-6 TaxID=2957982 RepID=UPI0020A09E7D|nr:tyrosine protein phosphatase [Notoacmeibacter sp. MSK16QG-6]MCP1199021.1 tyrosine protein phosphatase [Notoacmeibacter sp. MSK16QG-6]